MPEIVVLFSWGKIVVCVFIFVFLIFVFPKLQDGHLRNISELALTLHGHNISELIEIPDFHRILWALRGLFCHVRAIWNIVARIPQRYCEFGSRSSQ